MQRTKIIIIAISIVVPLVVAALFTFVSRETVVGDWVHKLPAFNALVNLLSAVVLILARVMIARGRESLHKRLMLTALALGALFLLSYLFYHASVPSTVYGDLDGDGRLSEVELKQAGAWRWVYLAVLLSHVLMAVVALPLIMLAVYYAFQNDRLRHRQIVRYTFPVWLYVSLTGVLVFGLISPYY